MGFLQFNDSDTIVALATPSGRSALAIIRVSGARSRAILEKCFSPIPEKLETHKAYYGTWKNSSTSEAIDEVLVLYFSDGRGFTGEESFEVTCHGSPEVIAALVESAIEAGARLAEPGEYSYRAVKNGRMDLVQAEGVLELIEARSRAGGKAALARVKGELSDYLKGYERDVNFLLANLEASIDFTTEDIQPVNYLEMAQKAGCVSEAIETLLASYSRGRQLQMGVKVGIFGLPNAGKSSLLNAFLGKERAIVSPEAGTTRDFIESSMQFFGTQFNFVDTAGLRKTADKIEAKGVEKSREILMGVDHILYLIDANAGVSPEDVEELKTLDPRLTTIVFTKADLLFGVGAGSEEEASMISMNANAFFMNSLVEKGLGQFSFCKTSVLNVPNLQEVLGVLQFLFSIEEEGEALLLASSRQKEELEKISASLKNAKQLMEKHESPEFISQELAIAYDAIQDVLGFSTKVDVMDRVFSEFCIGK